MSCETASNVFSPHPCSSVGTIESARATEPVNQVSGRDRVSARDRVSVSSQWARSKSVQLIELRFRTLLGRWRGHWHVRVLRFTAQGDGRGSEFGEASGGTSAVIMGFGSGTGTGGVGGVRSAGGTEGGAAVAGAGALVLAATGLVEVAT